jgi:DNA-binding NarL/FixJ family response regulator
MSQSKVVRLGARNAKPRHTPDDVPYTTGRDGKRYPRYRWDEARNQRRLLVLELRESGMTMRQIAAVVGCSVGTVARDLLLWDVLRELVEKSQQHD